MGHKKKRIFNDAFIARLLTIIALSLIIGMIYFSHKRHESEKTDTPLLDSVVVEMTESRR